MKKTNLEKIQKSNFIKINFINFEIVYKILKIEVSSFVQPFIFIVSEF